MEPRPKELERFTGIIRPFKEEDVPALKKIFEHWLQDDGVIAENEVEEDIETLRSSQKAGSTTTMFVAQTPDGKVIGTMGVNLEPKEALLDPKFRKTDDPSELIVAYVSPEYNRGHGVGTALINRCQEVAKAAGKKEMLLESGPRHRETGHGFYDNQPGFHRVDTIPNFYGPGLDTVVWQKTF